jgi:hypothetical protein
MSGRRRHPRYVMSNCEATLRVLSEVTVHEDEEWGLIAISDEPGTCGEVLTVELMNGSLVRTPVRVVESHPLVHNGSIRHRLALVQPRAGPPFDHTRGRMGVTRPRRPKTRPHQFDSEQREPGVLVQEIRVRMLNCSANGCLLESDRLVPVGTVTTLNVSIDGGTLSEIARVVRCREAERTARRYHHVAAEFLSVTPPYAGSLRHALRRDATELAGLNADGGAVEETKILTDTDNQNDGQACESLKTLNQEGFDTLSTETAVATNLLTGHTTAQPTANQP